MLSIIVYVTDETYLNKTIDSIIDTTEASLISEIIVCDDRNTESVFARAGIVVRKTFGVGYVSAVSQAAEATIGTVLAFVRDKTKFYADWVVPLIKSIDENKNALYSPTIHTLDLIMWASEDVCWNRFGWRWDLTLYNRLSSIPDSPAISNNCIVCDKSWFFEIGGFDLGMAVGDGADIELSLRSWLFGGGVYVCDESKIAVSTDIERGTNTTINLARIVEMWLPGHASKFYNVRGIVASNINIGRLNNLRRLESKQVRSIEWFLNSKQPELLGVYDLNNIATKKTVAVVGPGPSLDYVNLADINRYDIVIGVDYVGLLIECDYIITDSVNVISALRSRYSDDKFIVPIVLDNKTMASDVVPLATQIELTTAERLSIDPPFGDFDDLTVTAVQFALFLNPASITVFGCDAKIIDDKSHTSRIEYYNGGKVFCDGDAVRRRFANYESAFVQLREIALLKKIPMLRVCHA